MINIRFANICNLNQVEIDESKFYAVLKRYKTKNGEV